jgi:hypothetical protein
MAWLLSSSFDAIQLFRRCFTLFSSRGRRKSYAVNLCLSDKSRPRYLIASHRRHPPFRHYRQFEPPPFVPRPLNPAGRTHERRSRHSRRSSWRDLALYQSSSSRGSSWCLREKSGQRRPKDKCDPSDIPSLYRICASIVVPDM